MRKSCPVAVGLAATLVAASVSMASAGTYLNTIDDSAKLFNDGAVIAIGGPIGCPKGDLIDVHVLVSQGGKPVADGNFDGLCTGTESRWFAAARAWGPPARSGKAEAHAWATVWNGSQVERAWDWGKDIVLKGADAD